MTKDSIPTTPARALRLDLDWRWHRPKRRSYAPRGEPRPDERPIRLEWDGHITGAPAQHFPFEDNQFDYVDCGTVVAYVRNDEGLANELTRIVAPGGTVRLRVPATGPLAVFDAFNLHRYLVDVSKHGLRPFETADIGWRRHYSEDDLVKMFGSCRFTCTEMRRSGYGLSEGVRLAGFVLFRWWRASRNKYRRMSRLAERVRRVEVRHEWSHGYWLDATFRRTDDSHRSFKSRDLTQN